LRSEPRFQPLAGPDQFFAECRQLGALALAALADLGPYVAIHASIGWAPMAVTTNLSINFLKRPAQKDLLAETRLIKLGKRLAVADIAIRSEGEDELVAHATSTYSIPPTNS
jgi:uncharacterized protein (TIGR00369 family)